MAIQDYFNQTFTVYTKASRNVYGEPSFSAGSSFKGRLQEGEEFKKEFNGETETVMADAVTYVSPSLSINVEDILQTSDGTRYSILDIYEARNKTSVHHKKLMLRKTVR